MNRRCDTPLVQRRMLFASCRKAKARRKVKVKEVRVKKIIFVLCVVAAIGCNKKSEEADNALGVTANTTGGTVAVAAGAAAVTVTPNGVTVAQGAPGVPAPGAGVTVAQKG